MDADNIVVSEDAKRRVVIARLREFAFKIKSVLPGYDDEDVEALAQVLIEASDQGVPVTRAYVHKRLLALGRSADVADRLSKNFPN